MENLLIHITGNIGSGKSTLANLLRKEIGFPVFSIDDFRRKANANTLAGEWESWDLLKREVLKHNYLILETVGLSNAAEEITGLYRVVEIRLVCDVATLMKRIVTRKKEGYQDPPFCYVDGQQTEREKLINIAMKLDKKPLGMGFLIDSSNKSPIGLVEEVFEQLKN